MKYTKYRVVKEFGEYYIEIPFLWLFWKRLSYVAYHDIGMATYDIVEYYSFNTMEDAIKFAETHKYSVQTKDTQ